LTQFSNNSQKKKRVSINDKRIQEFVDLYSSGISPQKIQSRMKIAKSTYYKYLEVMKEISENYVHAMAEYGHILKFQKGLERMEKRRQDYDELLQKALKSNDLPTCLQILRAMDKNDWDNLQSLDNITLVKRFNEFIVKNIKEANLSRF